MATPFCDELGRAQFLAIASRSELLSSSENRGHELGSRNQVRAVLAANAKISPERGPAASIGSNRVRITFYPMSAYFGPSLLTARIKNDEIRFLAQVMPSTKPVLLYRLGGGGIDSKYVV
jgi:hypothetical protein